MIHTVASGIQLTDVVDPISVKPDQLQLTYMGDGTLQLSGLVRVRLPAYMLYVKLDPLIPSWLWL